MGTPPRAAPSPCHRNGARGLGAQAAESVDTVNDQPLNLEAFRQRLVALRQQLSAESDIDASATETVELDQTRMGRLSRMDAMQAQAISLASKNRREVQLRQVDAALRRIGEDDYGWCDACGDLIDARRLEFDPTTVLCITCAQKAEQ